MRNIAQWGMLALCVLGLLRWVRKLDDPLNSLMGIWVLGILFSVPFLPPTDAYRMRPYAASIIVFGLLPALGLLSGMERLKLLPATPLRLPGSDPDILVVFTSLLVFVTLFGPLLVKSIGHPPQFDQESCPPGTAMISISFDEGTHFNLLRERQPGLDWMPNFHIGRFRENAHSLPDPNMITWAEELDPLTSVFYTLDYRSFEKVLVVMSTAELPSPNSLQQVCGEWEVNPTLEAFNIFYAQAESSPP